LWERVGVRGKLGIGKSRPVPQALRGSISMSGMEPYKRPGDKAIVAGVDRVRRRSILVFAR
jgi:hypothetical protein